MVTSRERVLDALNHRTPDRTPFSWGLGIQPPAKAALSAHLRPLGLGVDELRRRTGDLLEVFPPFLREDDGRSIWGYTVKSVSYGAGSYNEFDYQPLAEAETPADVAAQAWPDAAGMDCESYLADFRRRDPDHERAWMIRGGNPLEIFQWMTGLEKSLMLMAVAPETCHAAMRRITDFFVATSTRTLAASEGQIDVVFCADDLGTQTGPMISRNMYRELVMPYHREIFAAVHEHGPKVMYHSDGSCFALLEDLLEAGIDCLEAVQIECRDMEAEKLKAAFGERLAFRGAVSVQQVLPRQDPAEVREEVARLKRILGEGGGYICAPSHAIQAGTPPENIVAMVEEATERSIEDIAAG